MILRVENNFDQIILNAERPKFIFAFHKHLSYNDAEFKPQFSTLGQL